MKITKGARISGCGLLVILFGIFWLLVDDLNGGDGERLMGFWIFETINLLVGAFLIIIGIRLWRRAKNDSDNF
jgi:hypothetical protein